MLTTQTKHVYQIWSKASKQNANKSEKENWPKAQQVCFHHWVNKTGSVNTNKKQNKIISTDFSGGTKGLEKANLQFRFFLESQYLHISLFQRGSKMRTKSDFAA